MSREPWDLEKVYDDQIAPLMTRIIAICKEHELPMIASFQYKPEDFCSTYLWFDGANDRLKLAKQAIIDGFLAYTMTRKE